MGNHEISDRHDRRYCSLLENAFGQRNGPMRLLITGVCGFVGSAIAQSLLERMENLTVIGIDNLIRPGSELNRMKLTQIGVKFVHGDIRQASDLDAIPPADCVIDAAANPSVLAGLQQDFTSRQLFEHNLAGLSNILEYCKRYKSTLILLSSSRVYSIPALTSLPLKVCDETFHIDDSLPLAPGVTARGIGVEFSTKPPVSLYGAMKLASEAVALEYGHAFGFPVWIDRCGVLAGAGQFGTPFFRTGSTHICEDFRFAILVSKEPDGRFEMSFTRGTSRAF